MGKNCLINDDLYPIGIIIHSTTLDTSTKVKAIYRGTTWTQITSKFLFGTGTIDMYNDSGTKTSTNVTAKSTGGSTSSTLTTSTIPAHTHGSKSLSGSFGVVNCRFNEFSGICSGAGANAGSGTNGGGATGYYKATVNATHEHTSVGGSKPHNNMPPYYGVYIWERTA